MNHKHAERVSADGAMPSDATRTEHDRDADARHRHPPAAIDPARRPRRPDQIPPRPKRREQHAAQHRPEPELVRRQHRHEEADAGDAGVAGERRRAQQPDAPREHGAAGSGGSLVATAPLRRHQRQPGGDHRLAELNAQPPVDRAQRAAAERRQRDRRRSARRRTSPPPARSGAAALRPPSPASSSGVKNAFALPCSARTTRNAPRVGHEGRGQHDRRRVGDVARCARRAGGRAARPSVPDTSCSAANGTR